MATANLSLMNNYSTQLVTSADYSTHGLMATTISYLATVVNVCALYSLNRYSRKQLGPFSLALTNLCVADLLVSLLRACNSTLWLFNASVHPSSVACEIIRFSMQFGVNASAFMVAFIGIDRALAVCRPLTVRSAARRRIKIFLLLAWIVSLISCLPMPLVFESDEDNERAVIRGIYICRKAIGDNPTTELLYICCFVVFFYVLPLAIMVTSYSVILCIIRKRAGKGLSNAPVCSDVLLKRHAHSAALTARVTIVNSEDSFTRLAKHYNGKTGNLHHVASLQNIYHEPITFERTSERSQPTIEQSSSVSQRVMKRSTHQLFKRAVQASVKTLFTIVITYIICWTPHYTLYLWGVIRINVENPELVEKDHRSIYGGFWLYLLTYLNPLINPLLYGKFHKQYSRHLSIGFRTMIRSVRRLRSV